MVSQKSFFRLDLSCKYNSGMTIKLIQLQIRSTVSRQVHHNNYNISPLHKRLYYQHYLQYYSPKHCFLLQFRYLFPSQLSFWQSTTGNHRRTHRKTKPITELEIVSAVSYSVLLESHGRVWWCVWGCMRVSSCVILLNLPAYAHISNPRSIRGILHLQIEFNDMHLALLNFLVEQIHIEQRIIRFTSGLH